MASVGLLYVGAVLFINAVMLLGRVDPKAAGVFNVFVGVLQVVTPTYLIMTAGGDLRQIAAASGIYLFGFTYLYVGINLLAGIDSTGLGWFSLFVAIAALGYAFYNGVDLKDYPFAVIWLYWSFLWLLFFLLLGLKREELTPYTGWVTLVESWVTGAIPGYLLLTDRWSTSGFLAVALAVFGVVAFAALWVRFSPRRLRPADAAAASGT